MIERLDPKQIQNEATLAAKINEIVAKVNDLIIKVRDIAIAQEALLNRLPGGPGFG